MAESHGLIIGEIDPEPLRDLLRAPTAYPSPITAMWPVAADERRASRAGDLTVAVAHDTRETILDVFAQPRVLDQLARLGSLRNQVGLPLRDRRSILELATTSRRVAAQLT